MATKKAPSKSKPSPKKKPAPKKKVEAVPAKYGTASPYLVVSPCAEAIQFYVQAFGAKVLSSMPGPGGLIMHAELKVGDSIIMMADQMPPPDPSLPDLRRSPKSIEGKTTGGVMLYVPNVDKAFARAIAAGATAVQPPQDQFWGDRYGQLIDPFGHIWSMATHLRDMTPKQMMTAMAALMPPTK